MEPVTLDNSLLTRLTGERDPALRAAVLSDLLEVLFVLAEAGVPVNDAIERGLELVLRKRGPDGG